MLTSRRAFGVSDLEEIGIPELYGKYDEAAVAQGLVAIGQPNPLRTGLRGFELPWTMDGKLQGRGYISLVSPVDFRLAFNRS